MSAPSTAAPMLSCSSALEAGAGERIANIGALRQRHRQQDAFDGDVSVAGLFRDLLGLVE